MNTLRQDREQTRDDVRMLLRGDAFVMFASQKGKAHNLQNGYSRAHVKAERRGTSLAETSS